MMMRITFWVGEVTCSIVIAALDAGGNGSLSIRTAGMIVKANRKIRNNSPTPMSSLLRATVKR